MRETLTLQYAATVNKLDYLSFFLLIASIVLLILAIKAHKKHRKQIFNNDVPTKKELKKYTKTTDEKFLKKIEIKIRNLSLSSITTHKKLYIGAAICFVLLILVIIINFSASYS